jgi:FtsH-binding integral membrane protein
MTTSTLALKLKVQASSLNATILAVVTALAGMVVGLGLINSAQEGLIIATTTGGIGVVGLLANTIHTGNIEPSALTTAVLAVVGQAVSLIVSFALISNETAGTVISVITAVVGAAAITAHALLSKQVSA